jgi:hypothetical protein
VDRNLGPQGLDAQIGCLVAGATGVECLGRNSMSCTVDGRGEEMGFSEESAEFEILG